MHKDAVCWMNGELMPAREASVSVFDHGLLYGDGVFEGIRFYNRRSFRLNEHLERLFMSARAIALEIPYDPGVLVSAVAKTITAFEQMDGYLRMVVTRGAGPMGLDPRACTRPNVFIIADTLHLASREAREQGARVIIAATRRLPADGLDPRIKSLNYLNHILARIEASHAGADEAILLNGQGRITEGTAENLFIVRKGELLTPPVTEGALEGVTRNCIMELAEAKGVNLSEKPLAPYDLYTADECFFTGTGAELIPIREVDGRPVRRCPGKVFSMLQTNFRKMLSEELQATNLAETGR